MKSLFSKVAIVLSLSFFYPIFSANAADSSINLSVEPSVFLINLQQGDSWSSSIRINNNNKKDLSYSLSLIDFEKDTKGEFFPVLNTLRRIDNNESDIGNGSTLSSWIKTSNTAVYIKKDLSAVLPFKVEIPPDAEPGDYRAAILVGVSPDSVINGGSSLSVSSLISSTLSIKVTGKVDKGLIIKGFSPNQLVYENPDVTFILKTQNSGHVRVTPEGSLEIRNIFGQKVGDVLLSKDIMSKKQYADDKISSYNFNWRLSNGDFGLGPYIATVSLSYGDKDKKTVSSSSVFWVIPIKMILALTLLILGLFIGGDYLIKLYLRRYF